MYYVLEVELRSIGTLKILNDGKPFESLESAQMYCDELSSKYRFQFFDYYDFKIIKKIESEFSCNILIELLS